MTVLTWPGRSWSTFSYFDAISAARSLLLGLRGNLLRRVYIANLLLAGRDARASSWQSSRGEMRGTRPGAPGTLFRDDPSPEGGRLTPASHAGPKEDGREAARAA